MSVLPDPAKSRAVLVGTSRYEHLEQLPAVSNNLQGLAELLSSPVSLHLPTQHVTVLENPAAAHTVMREVRQAAAEATDTLVVYFAGHGLIDPQGTLGLALPHTEFGRVETGLPYDWIRQGLLQESRAERHVIILDCCYSGLALGRMSASLGIADQAAVEGSFLLTAAAETRTALAPIGDTYTAFTRALLDTLRHGIPGGSELLDLGAVFRHLRNTLEARGHPLPQARDRNTAADVALGRNHAALHTSPESFPTGAAAARPLVETADGRLDSPGARTDTLGEQIGIPGQGTPPPSTSRVDSGFDTSVPPGSEAAARPGRKGRGPRTALIGAACLALLTGGYLVWDYSQYNELTDSETINAARDYGKLKIGVKDNQPGLSDNTGTEYSPHWVGFDVEFARNIAEKLGFEKEDEIEFVPVDTENREHYLKNNLVDLVVSSYSITDDRKKEVDFAGPYLNTDQGMLVYTDGKETSETRVVVDGVTTTKKIKTPEDFPQGTAVCTARTSTTNDVIKTKFPKAKFDVQDTADYQSCIDLLNHDDSVHVMVTDRPILAGFLKENPKLRLVGGPIVDSQTQWGVGLQKGDRALRHFVCESIEEQINSGTWRAIYKAELEDVLANTGIIPSPSEEEDREENCD